MFHVRVPDADETYAHALAAGATPERPVANQHGQRAGSLFDPFGHRWSVVSDEKPDRP
jgi:PhnB protein